MKNMKIEVNGNLDEIVVELEILGFNKSITVGAETGVFVYADRMDKKYFEDGRNLLFYKLTSISELEEMK